MSSWLGIPSVTFLSAFEELRKRREAAITMKTILIPTEDNDAMRSVLETALLLAKRCDSYMEGFALRWSIAEFGGLDVMGGVP